MILQGLTVDEFWAQLEARTEAVVQRTIAKYNEQAEKDRLVTMKEVMAMLGVTAPTVNAWVKAGKLRKLKIGAAVRFRESDVKAAVSMINPLRKTG